MPVNLFDEVKDLFNNELVTKASIYINESETGVAKAITGILPIVFEQLVNKTFTHEGAGSVAQMAGQQHLDTALNGQHIFDNDNLSQNGTRLLQNIFDNRLEAVTALLSNFSGLTTSSLTALLNITVPAVLGTIGKHSTGGASGMAELLHSQKENIAAAMPGGLNSSAAAGEWNAATYVSTVPATIITNSTAIAESESIPLLLLALLLLVMAAIAVGYLF